MGGGSSSIGVVFFRCSEGRCDFSDDVRHADGVEKPATTLLTFPFPPNVEKSRFVRGGSCQSLLISEI